MEERENIVFNPFMQSEKVDKQVSIIWIIISLYVDMYNRKDNKVP